jgi:hypothetical protein
MSIDTSVHTDSPTPLAGDSSPHERWKSLRKKIIAHDDKLSTASVFATAAAGGSVYRWGVAAATGKACDDAVTLLSRLACGIRPAKGKSPLDLPAAVQTLLEQLEGDWGNSPIEAAAAVLWAASLPALSAPLDEADWWQLLGALQELHASTLARGHDAAPAHLMLGGELGLTLAWRLGFQHDCRQLRAASIDAVEAWCRHADSSVSAVLARCTDARLVLASLIRCQRILRATTRRKPRKSELRVASELSTWVAAMTLHSGGTALSPVARRDVKDDLPPHGLLAAAMEFDRDALQPAISAALGASQTGGRLAWQVSLPAPLQHDPQAKLAILLPEWDVRRGRTHVDYSAEQVRIEVFAGRRQVIDGDWQTMIEIDELEQQPRGAWTEVCEYSDDDVHYLEIEQPWTGGALLQRQLMLIREDRCLLLADAVLPDESSGDPLALGRIRYASRLPLHELVHSVAEAETREMFLCDSHRRVLVIPLSASEWRVGPSEATVKESPDNCLLASAQSHGRLFVPLWFDFQRRRFKRRRTWRQLTVADQLRIVPRNEATGHRLQIGSEHWCVYRSLGTRACRSVLGKHLIAGFFCSRFEPSGGNHEELINVDDSDADDE